MPPSKTSSAPASTASRRRSSRAAPGGRSEIEIDELTELVQIEDARRGEERDGDDAPERHRAGDIEQRIAIPRPEGDERREREVGQQGRNRAGLELAESDSHFLERAIRRLVT